LPEFPSGAANEPVAESLPRSAIASVESSTA
jgi:hypothetical protein